MLPTFISTAQCGMHLFLSGGQYLFFYFKLRFCLIQQWDNHQGNLTSHRAMHRLYLSVSDLSTVSHLIKSYLERKSRAQSSPTIYLHSGKKTVEFQFFSEVEYSVLL